MKNDQPESNAGKRISACYRTFLQSLEDIREEHDKTGGKLLVPDEPGLAQFIKENQPALYRRITAFIPLIHEAMNVVMAGGKAALSETGPEPQAALKTLSIARKLRPEPFDDLCDSIGIELSLQLEIRERQVCDLQHLAELYY
ncbi:MAG: hypothetical protein ACQKBU_07840, partial [Verrucomicrobiales bacterium]